jgi:predicted MFS family arabinose efflux permease
MTTEEPRRDAPDLTGSAETEEEISSGYAHYVLGVLLTVNVINFIDRQVLSIFIGPIKEEFGVSDTSIGLLVGFGFALFYTIAGIPIARWADRSSRRSIIAIGMALWSAMTVASGLARSFLQLAFIRIWVGVGEAAASPPSHSLLSDYFPVNRRATAIGIYASGVYIGSAIAYLFGGYLRANFDWRTAFFVLGAPGLLFALIVRFTIREPSRGRTEVHGRDASRTTLGETLRHLLSCRSWIYLMAGSAVLSVTGFGVLMWSYEFYGRVHGMPPIDIGIWLALVVGGGGSLGVYAGGRIADRIGETDPAWYLRLPALVNLASLPFAYVFLMSDSSERSLAFFFVFYACINVYVPALHAINQNLSKLRMRATTAAIGQFVTSLMGAGLGPFVVGLLNDLLEPRFGNEAIRYSFAIITATGAVGSLFLYLSSRHLKADLERVRG